MNSLAWLTVPVLLAGAGTASAATVYDQPGTTACDPSCWTSHYGAGSGFRAYDDFTLASAATITSVSWQGIYIPTPPTATAPGPDTTTWDIGFFSDSGDFPGVQLASAALPAASVTTTFLSSGTFGSQPVNLYSFTATLPTGFTAAAGTKYWFSPVSLAPSFDPFFSWSPSTAIYDNLTAQTDTGGGTYLRSNDRAFALTATVPEPTSWGLMIAGFALTGATLRRRAVAPARRVAA